MICIIFISSFVALFKPQIPSNDYDTMKANSNQLVVFMYIQKLLGCLLPKQQQNWRNKIEQTLDMDLIKQQVSLLFESVIHCSIIFTQDLLSYSIALSGKVSTPVVYGLSLSYKIDQCWLAITTE